MTPAEDVLIEAWRQLAGSDHSAVEEAIVVRHAEPHRRYHTAEHVMWVLRHVDTLLAVESVNHVDLDSDAIRAGALFHDIVYDPRSRTNESDSASLADGFLSDLGWLLDRRRLVSEMIEATATHRTQTAEAALLLDADLAILGSDPVAYYDYVAAVRCEFGFVDDSAWRTGRSAVLRSFLDRQHLFVTATMSAARQAQARVNMSAELASLTAGFR